jgi:hypothetical protein
VNLNCTPRPSWVVVLVLILPVLACNVLSPTASPAPTEVAAYTPVPPTTVVIPTPTYTPSGPCEAVTSTDVTIYERPDFSADVFSTVPAGFATPVDGQTASGWLGFDPGVAQAANIGPFRLRWIERDKVNLAGACGSVPVVWAPPPGICFDMPMEAVEVRADPTTTSAVLVVLNVEQFASVLGVNATGWAKVDLSPGNTGSTVQGWIEQTTLNMNGPCENLPSLTQ